MRGGKITIMPARSYLIFGDIEGKLDVLRVECTKCARKGRYSVRRQLALSTYLGTAFERETLSRGDAASAGCVRDDQRAPPPDLRLGQQVNPLACR
jgi:hypothetical protein